MQRHVYIQIPNYVNSRENAVWNISRHDANGNMPANDVDNRALMDSSNELCTRMVSLIKGANKVSRTAVSKASDRKSTQSTISSKYGYVTYVQ